MKKKILALGIVASLLFPASFASAEDSIRIEMDGTEQNFPVKPYIKNGRTLVPMSFISEKLGATVTWNGTSRTITAVKGNDTIILKIGSDTVIQNGTEMKMEAAPEISQDRTMVPLSFVINAFDIDIDWDSPTRTVKIYSNADLEKTVYITDENGNPIANESDVANAEVTKLSRYHRTNDLYDRYKAQHITFRDYNGQRTAIVLTTRGVLVDGKIMGDYMIIYIDLGKKEATKEIRGSYSKQVNVSLKDLQVDPITIKEALALSGQ